MGIANPDLCVTLANGQVRAAYMLRDDLLAVLFPHGGVLPTELLQSRVRIKLKALTSALERSLMKTDGDANLSWPRLSETGLLRENALIDFALARISEEELSVNLRGAQNAAPLGQLPVVLLGHNNDRIADMARGLLSAAQASAGPDQIYYHRLDSELLHLMTWRVAAALIDAEAMTSDAATMAVQNLLGQHDSKLDPLAIARKLVFFLGAEHRDAVKDPIVAGLHLFIAALGKEYDLPDDFVLRIIGSDHSAPLLLMLKGQELSLDTARSILIALKGNSAIADLTSLELDYAALDPVEARAAVLAWREDPPA